MVRKRALTPRQKQCLEWRARKFSNKEIGRHLNVSPATVAMHLRLARAKLQHQQCEARRSPERASDELHKRIQSELRSSADFHTSWFDLMTKAAASALLWLTILALLALVSSPLITRLRSH
jgi:IS30 family transposase